MRNRASSAMLAAIAWVALSGFLSPRLSADEAKSASEIKSFSRQIDFLIDKRLRAAGVKPAPPTGDAQFLRRVSLDLTGRIPDLLDVRDFLDPTNNEPDKRWSCVERMLQAPEYADHFANVWRATLIPTVSDKLVRSFEDWLRQYLKKNTPYDRVVHHLLTAPFWPGDWKGGWAFYSANENNAGHVASATAQVFLGVQLECAQCHDHPPRWTRRQFWEFTASFDGNDGSPPAAKNRIGRQITIPGTATVVKAKFPTGQEPLWKEKDDGRKILADWITAKENPFFGKATVDLVWSHFFHVSLLHPNGGDSITHAELLDELARQFVGHGYDLKFLIRAIVHTNAYQRRSEVARGSSPKDLLLLARMPVWRLSPEQIFDSFAVAADYKAPPLSNVYVGGRPGPRSEFMTKFGSEDQHSGRPATALRTLLATKGTFFAKRTELDLSITSEKTATLSELDRRNINVSLHTLALQQDKALNRRLENLYMLVLSRPPRDDEMARHIRFVQAARDPRHAFVDVYRALLSSDEFVLNH
jgi:hypothetical protein